MRIKILGSGTSTGVPVPSCRCRVCCSGHPRNERLRTSALITVSDAQNILIDTTTDLRQQALRWDIRSVSSVLFTHAHADHIFGIDDLKSFNFTKRGVIPCFGQKETLDVIRKSFSYIFEPDPDYRGGMLPDLTLNEIEDTALFEVCGSKVQAFPLLHGHMKVLGYRFGELAYATDCKAIPAASKEILKGVRYLILDGLRYEPHFTHFTIPEAINAAQEIGAEMTYLIHMTHTVDHDEVSAKLPRGVALAYDGLEIEFSGTAGHSDF